MTGKNSLNRAMAVYVLFTIKRSFVSRVIMLGESVNIARLLCHRSGIRGGGKKLNLVIMLRGVQDEMTDLDH